jgi:hypothetical protein
VLGDEFFAMIDRGCIASRITTVDHQNKAVVGAAAAAAGWLRPRAVRGPSHTNDGGRAPVSAL